MTSKELINLYNLMCKYHFQVQGARYFYPLGDQCDVCRLIHDLEHKLRHKGITVKTAQAWIQEVAA